MAQYATADEFREQNPDVDVQAITGTPDTAAADVKLNRALTTASDVIDGYLAGEYALPLATVPGNIKAYTCDIALYRLLPNRGAEENKDPQNRHDAAIRYLERVQKGAAHLPGLLRLGETEESATVNTAGQEAPGYVAVPVEYSW